MPNFGQPNRSSEMIGNCLEITSELLSLIFGISTFAAAAEDYSSTINVFRDSPVPAEY